jgi:hypothetical protein
LIFNVWRTTGQDPYQLYNELDTSYRPVDDPSQPPRPPRFPERVRLFLYACGQRQFQLEEERLMRQAQTIAKTMGG